MSMYMKVGVNADKCGPEINLASFFQSCYLFPTQNVLIATGPRWWRVTNNFLNAAIIF